MKYFIDSFNFFCTVFAVSGATKDTAAAVLTVAVTNNFNVFGATAT